MAGKFNAPARRATVTEHVVIAAWSHRCTACDWKIMPGDHYRRLDIVTANGTEQTAKACNDRCAVRLATGTAA